MKKLPVAISWVDHLLVTVGCALSTYAISMSMGRPAVAQFFLVAILAAALIGYLVARALAKRPAVRYDGYLFAGFGLFSLTQVLKLNSLLPEEGFPFTLIVRCWLCWLMVFGLLVSWRDECLLFLTLPSIAVFGLVGTFDTYPMGTLMFFLFVVCAAVLYARVHQRAMLEQAKKAGVEDATRLGRDAWRWMAGPEWALASAGIIVLFSLMGAPIIKVSLQEVAKNVNLPSATAPSIAPTRSVVAPDVRVGEGPLYELSETPVFKVKMDRARLLHEQHFNLYTGQGWNRSRYEFMMDTGGSGRVDWVGTDQSSEISDPKRLTVDFAPTGMLRFSVGLIPLPGPLDLKSGASVDSAVRTGKDGHLDVDVVVPKDGAVPKSASMPRDVMATGEAGDDMAHLTDRVRQLAHEAASKGRTDYQRAVAIMHAIESQAKYNLEAPKVPNGQDAVDYFLFDSKEGYCDLFATSMTTMARAEGMSARYVEGWLVDESEKDAGGYYTVRSKDRHAWCEIYFDGFGWVPFDATEGAESVSDEGRGNRKHGPWYQEDWFASLLNWIAGLGIACAAAAVLVPRHGGRLYRMLLRRVKAPVAVQLRSEVGRAHSKFQQAIESRVGFPRRYSHTTREYVELAAAKLGPLAEDAQQLVERFEAALFSPTGLDETTLSSLHKGVGDFRTALRKLPRAHNDRRSGIRPPKASQA